MSEAERLARINSALFKKHFALWTALQTPENRRASNASFSASLARAGARSAILPTITVYTNMPSFRTGSANSSLPASASMSFSATNGVCRYGTRSISTSLNTFRSPAKIDQKLYADMLTAENWGGVWRDVAVNAKTVRPHWLRPIRFAAKLAHAPLGRDAWHRFEQRYLQYWMAGGGQAAITPYRVVACDRRGARNAISWLSEDYLAGHGLDYAGDPLRA